MDRIRQRKPSARELREARDYALGQMRMGLESTTNQMFFAGESVLGYGRPGNPDKIEEKVHTITAEAITEVAQTVFVRNHSSIASISNNPHEEALAL